MISLGLFLCDGERDSEGLGALPVEVAGGGPRSATGSPWAPLTGRYTEGNDPNGDMNP